MLALSIAGCFAKQPAPDRFVCGAGDCAVTLELENRDDLPLDVIVRIGSTRTASVCTALIAGESKATCRSAVPLGSRVTFETVETTFEGWGGDCGGQTGTCILDATRPIVARAAFGCVRTCDGTLCGDDGCGGSCACSDERVCIDGACECPPQCPPDSCGLNACGELCRCPEGSFCSSPFGGTCVCAPVCDGRECGDDACGGDCGTCQALEACSNGRCVCSPGPAPPVSVVIALDASASMGSGAGTLPCGCPFHCARRALTELSRGDRVVAAWLGCESGDDGVLADYAPLYPAVVTFNAESVETACFGASEAGLGAVIAGLPASGGGSLVLGLAAAAAVMRDALTGTSSRAAIVMMTDGRDSLTPPITFDFACDGTTLEITAPDMAPAAAAYLHGHDVLCRVEGTQPIRTYVVAVDPPSSAESAFLEAVATAGGGLYFTATTATAAQAALRSILIDLGR